MRLQEEGQEAKVRRGRATDRHQTEEQYVNKELGNNTVQCWFPGFKRLAVDQYEFHNYFAPNMINGPMDVETFWPIDVCAKLVLTAAVMSCFLTGGQCLLAVHLLRGRGMDPAGHNQVHHKWECETKHMDRFNLYF